MALLVAGCPSETSVGPPSKPYAGVSLKLAAPADPAVRSLLERHGQAWASGSGASLEFVTADTPADMRLFRPAEAGRLESRLASIDVGPLKKLEAFQFSRLLGYEIDHDMAWGERVIGLPVLGESFFFVYRADLVENPRHAAALAKRFKERFHYAMRPTGPATWQQVAELAAYFAGEPNWVDGEAAATPRPSLTPLPASAVEFDRDFHAVAASFVRRTVKEEKMAALPPAHRAGLLFSYQIDAETGAPAIADDGFVAALKFLQDVQRYRPSGTSERPLEAFRAGKAVFALASLADLPWLQADDSPVRDRFGVGRVPGSDTAIDPAKRKLAQVPDQDGNFIPYRGHGGWLGGIDAAASGASAVAANDLLVYLSSPPVSLEIACEPQWGGGPTRSTHLDNRPGWHNYGLGARTGQLIEALHSYYRAPIVNPSYALRVSGQSDLVRTFGEQVRPALTEKKDAAAALRETAEAWSGLTKDRAAFLREYRLSIGLK
jgi:hypothetical protein